MTPAKLFLTGPVGVGKTTVINTCLQGYTGPLAGFRSWKQDHERPGDATIWLSDVQKPDACHRIARFKPGRPKRFLPHVFDGAGVEILAGITAQTPGLVLMDEIGFIESDAPAFQAQVLRVLALPVPVLGVLRQRPTPFLDALRAGPRLTVLAVTPENRTTLPGRCRVLLGLPGAGE